MDVIGKLNEYKRKKEKKWRRLDISSGNSVESAARGQ
jgi:hypothetical protein